MIPKDFITVWRARAPWRLDAQVEQDLVISRAIVDLFSVPEVASSLVFRGGTALYKIYLTPPARYSEDIDLVQVRAEPIGETLDRARAALDPWLGSGLPVKNQHNQSESRGILALATVATACRIILRRPRALCPL